MQRQKVNIHQLSNHLGNLLATVTDHRMQANQPYHKRRLAIGGEFYHPRSYFQNESDAYTRQFFGSPASMPFSITHYREINRKNIEGIIRNGVQQYRFHENDFGEFRQDSMNW